MLERDRLRDVERFDATPRRPIREIVEGPVRVRGFIRAVVPTCDDRGVFCVACEALPDGSAAATPRQARGGVFELVDSDGDSTWVDARHVDARGYREAATAWVLQGTAARPVVLRVV